MVVGEGQWILSNFKCWNSYFVWIDKLHRFFLGRHSCGFHPIIGCAFLLVSWLSPIFVVVFPHEMVLSSEDFYDHCL
jgi:hypothetical protein